jgi:hypothetical protein
MTKVFERFYNFFILIVDTYLLLFSYLLYYVTDKSPSTSGKCKANCGNTMASE